ncbi:MAG TPA: 4-alpha-glucanotransferase [Gemmatimonadota bacterium]|nr:4-alpha-glucanotransferase [Gemmatimonadota bacterium]
MPELVRPLHPDPGNPPGQALEALARAWDIETVWRDGAGSEARPSTRALRGALAALGVPVETPIEVEDALWQRQQELHLRLAEPVCVSWAPDPPVVELRLSLAEQGRGIECRLAVEDGGTREWVAAGPRIELPADLPIGCHRLEYGIGEREGGTWVLRAPPVVADPARRGWVSFLPLYSLRTRRSWGAGDLTDLAALLDWTRSLGGEMVGTLPLLSAFLDQPFEPSPYKPVSRLFWNELYLDPESAPELAESPGARAVLESDAHRRAVSDLRRFPLVDYRAAMESKRAVLEPLASAFFEGEEWRSEAFQEFLGENPEVRTYVRFRAACELWERGWRDWPARMRDGTLHAGDFPEDSARYHLYAQWLASRQLGRLAAAGSGRGLYLDLPLGVHPDGYDAWRWRRLFADGARTGAPPDVFHAGGQDWGARPLQPERLREDGYRYFAACLRNLCRHAGALRIDHVMGLHRLWWVPEGMEATDGVYVRYRPEEAWAVVCIESSRSGTEIVGGDLGTVPPEVRMEMERRKARRMYVLPFGLRDGPPRLEPVPALSAASLDTHDLPPFARWWAEAPEGRRRELADALERAGVLEAAPEAESATQRIRRVLDGALRFLSDSEARLLIVNLENLWLETEPQNEPGTSMQERTNWRRKTRFSFETFREMPEVLATLRGSVRRR